MTPRHRLLRRGLLIGTCCAALARAFAAATSDEAAAAKLAGDFPRAIALYTELAAGEPQNPSHLYNLGTVLGWSGRYDEALATLERALALAPHDNDIRLARARVLAWSGRLGQADAACREVLADDPGNLEGLNLFGRLHAWRRQFDAARAVYQRILAAAPENTDALIGLGDVERFDGRFDEARAIYQRAAAVEPGSADIRRRLESVRRAGRWRLDAGFEYSGFDGDSREDWEGAMASLRYSLDRRTGVVGIVEDARRFGRRDRQYSLGLDRRFSDVASGYLRVSATPDADFFARRTVALGGTWRVRPGDGDLGPTVLTADLRAATYGPGTAESASIGVTQYTGRRVAVTVRGLVTRNVNDRGTGGWQLRLDGEPSDHWRWYAGFADGHESLSSTLFDFTRQLRTRALFGGASYEFSAAWGLRVDLTHEWSEGSPDRNAIHVGFTSRF